MTGAKASSYSAWPSSTRSLMASNTTSASAPFAGVVTFLVNMPLPTTFSGESEVQAVLATLPFLLLGPLFISLSFLQLSLHQRVSPTTLMIYLAVSTAFLSSLLDLFNVLFSEAAQSTTLGKPLAVASAITIAFSLLGKFLWLLAKTEMPLSREDWDGEKRGSLSKENIAFGEKGGRWRRESIWIAKGKRARERLGGMGNAGSYDRWGAFGDLAKWTVAGLILLVCLLEGIWRILFISKLGFLKVYFVDQGIQIALSVFFAIKLLATAYSCKVLPRSQNFIEILPTLIGISILFGVEIANVAPGLLALSDTPLGRLLTLIELVIFLLTTVLQDFKLALPTSSLPDYMSEYSFDNNLDGISNGNEKTESPLAPTPLQLSRNPTPLENVVPTPPTPPKTTTVMPTPPLALPAKIVVRKDSRIPSWFAGPRGGRKSSKRNSDEDLTSFTPPMPPIDRSKLNSDPNTDLESQQYTVDFDPVAAFDYFYAREAEREATESQLSGGNLRGRNDEARLSESVAGTFGRSRGDENEDSRITFTGGKDPFEDPSGDRDRRKPSEVTMETIRPPQGMTKGHAKRPSAASMGVYDSKGLRISSPNLDFEFNIGAYANFSNPSSIPADYTFPPPTSKGKSSDTPTSNDLNRSLSQASESSSTLSDLSLSKFPRPPPGGGLPPGLGSSSEEVATTAKPLTSFDQISQEEKKRIAPGRGVLSRPPPTIVSDQGVEFELFPPGRPSFDDNLRPGEGERERDSYGSAFSNNYGVPSMIIGPSTTIPVQSHLRQVSLGPISESGTDSPDSFAGEEYNRFEDDSMLSPLPHSPAESESAEIRQATFLVPRTTSGTSTGTFLSPTQSKSKTLRVSAIGIQGAKPRKSAFKPLVEETGRVIPPTTTSTPPTKLDVGKLSVPGGAIGLPSTPKSRRPRRPSSPAASSITSEGSPSPSPSTTAAVFSAATSAQISPEMKEMSMGGAYDPRRPFEKPRPVPLVLIGVGERMGSMGGGGGAAGAVPKKRVVLRGGTRKDIVVVRRDEEETLS